LYNFDGAFFFRYGPSSNSWNILVTLTQRQKFTPYTIPHTTPPLPRIPCAINSSFHNLERTPSHLGNAPFFFRETVSYRFPPLCPPPPAPQVPIVLNFSIRMFASNSRPAPSLPPPKSEPSFLATRRKFLAPISFPPVVVLFVQSCL